MEHVTIRTQPDYRLAAFSHRGPYTEIGAVFDKLGAWAFKEGLTGPDAIMIGIYYDDPGATPAAELRSDACCGVPAEYTPKAPAHLIELKGGECAVYRHVGPYSGLPDAWMRLYQEWLPQSGRSPADQAPYERYLNAPRDTPPEQLITEIYMPLRPVA